MNRHAEIIDLASEGYFYPTGSVLSSGTVKIFPITAQQEELLSNGNLLNRGLLDKEFLDEVVYGGVDFNTLLHCDKVSILLNLRSLNYGTFTKLKIICDSCEVEYEQEVSLAFKGIPFSFYGCERGVNRLKYTFPRCKKSVYFKLPTVNEQLVYAQHGWLAFAKHITLSVDGVDDVDNFYDFELSASDSKSFRTHYEKNMPGYNNSVLTKCTSCGSNKKIKMDVDCKIFGVNPGSGPIIHSEIFELCYYGNGAFTQDVVYNMPTRLRSFYIQKLVDAKKTEAEAQKKSASGPSHHEIARPPTAKS